MDSNKPDEQGGEPAMTRRDVLEMTAVGTIVGAIGGGLLVVKEAVESPPQEERKNHPPVTDHAAAPVSGHVAARVALGAVLGGALSAGIGGYGAVEDFLKKPPSR